MAAVELFISSIVYTIHLMNYRKIHDVVKLCNRITAIKKKAKVFILIQCHIAKLITSSRKITSCDLYPIKTNIVSVPLVLSTRTYVHFTRHFARDFPRSSFFFSEKKSLHLSPIVRLIFQFETLQLANFTRHVCDVYDNHASFSTTIVQRLKRKSDACINTIYEEKIAKKSNFTGKRGSTL